MRRAATFDIGKSDLGTGVERASWILPASLLLHLLAGLALALIPFKKPPATVIKRRFVVEIVPPPRGAGSGSGGTVAPSGDPPRKTTRPDGLTQAKRLYSAEIWADPRSRKALDMLPQLASEERIVQLCNAEAMEQIQQSGKGFLPNMLVPYAISDSRIEGLALIADGAAFQSAGQWYHVRFNCTVSADMTGVAAFAFRTGDAIPADEWEDYSLPSGDISPD